MFSLSFLIRLPFSLFSLRLIAYRPLKSSSFSSPSSSSFFSPSSSSFSSPSSSIACPQHPLLSLHSCTVGHLGDAEMIKEHVNEAVTLIGALNCPGVSKLTMASAYHKLASSFLSSVSSVNFSPSVSISVSPRYSVSASLLLTSSPSLSLSLSLSLSFPIFPSLSLFFPLSPSLSLSLSPSVFHCFSVSVMLSPSVSDFHFMCFVWCVVTCYIILILITHIRPTRQYEIKICA